MYKIKHRTVYFSYHANRAYRRGGAVFVSENRAESSTIFTVDCFFGGDRYTAAAASAVCLCADFCSASPKTAPISDEYFRRTASAAEKSTGRKCGLGIGARDRMYCDRRGCDRVRRFRIA